MKLYSSYLIFLFFFWSITVNAQTHYNIQLHPIEGAPSGQVCYEVQLASADGVDMNLAGQNYRLYFDGGKLQYNEEGSQSLLPLETYTNLIVKDNVQNIDASGSGNLAFDNHLSFLNLGNDLKDELNGGVILPASGTWISTANICFNVLEDVNTNATNDFDLFWARAALTESYATAYVEVSAWQSPTKTIPAIGVDYYDQELSTNIEEEIWDTEPTVYPNPTKDRIFIDYLGQEALLVQIYNSMGQLFIERDFPANATKQILDISNFSSGIYQVRLSNANKQIIKRIEVIQ